MDTLAVSVCVDGNGLSWAPFLHPNLSNTCDGRYFRLSSKRVLVPEICCQTYSPQIFTRQMNPSNLRLSLSFENGFQEGLDSFVRSRFREIIFSYSESSICLSVGTLI